MATTFAAIPHDLYGQEDFHDMYKDAQWESLTQEQSKKLAGIFHKESAHEPMSSDNVSNSPEVIIHGDIADVLDQLPPDQLQDIYSGITHVLSQQKNGDLLIGQRAKQKGLGWETTIGDAGFREGYNVISKKNEKDLPSGSAHYLLLLRVRPRHKHQHEVQNVDMSAELVEIPSYSAPRVSMLTPGMIFKKELDSHEFLQYLHNQPNDILIGQAA